MRGLLRTFQALECLGAKWSAIRVTRGSVFNTIQCSTLVQMDDGVVRGSVEARGAGSEDRHVKAEVVCYLGGRLNENGGFNTKGHPKSETVKIYEYSNTALLKYSSGFFGFGAGFRPASIMPVDHQWLTDFAEHLIARSDRAQTESEAAKVAKDGVRKSANEARARRALFGPVP